MKNKMYFTTKAIQNVLCIFNVLCAVLGIALVWYGIWLLQSVQNTLIDHGEELAASVIIVLGFAVLTSAAFGCVALFMQSKRMLMSFVFVLFLLFAIQIILMRISYSAIYEELPAGLRKGFDELFDNSELPVNGTLASYEEWLQCCGKDSAQDYFLLDKVLPNSCCLNHNCKNIMNLYVHGCEQKYKEYVARKTHNFNRISWMTILAEIVSLVVSCILLDCIKTQRERIRLYT